MDNLYSSFYLYKKYEIIGDELIDLGITSIDGEGTQEPVMKEECDPACGCVIYRWVQTEDTVCIEVQYRWTESGTTCIGYDKYQNNIKEESIDGVNWSVVIPEEYSASTLIQRNSEDCGYIPPLEGAYRLFLNNGTRVTGDCCPETACSLDWHDISMNYSGSVVSAEIGGCIDFLNNAFAWCTKLSAVTLYEGITELRGYPTGNYDGVFYKCTSLSSVTLPDSLEIIGEGSFYRSGLQDVTFGTGVTTIGDLAFGECTGLTSMTIPDGVTSIGQQAFDACYGLTSITIPNSVTSLGSGAFRNCTGLTNVNISTGVTYINDSTFQNCKSLTAITIPNSVTGIGGWSFSGCAFTSLDIPNSITNIGFQAFRRCRSLTAVTIGTGITRINEEAFTECNRLQSITINATTPPTLGDYPFYDTNNCPIYVPCESVDAYKAATGWSTYASRIEGIPPCGQPTPTIDGKFKLTLSDSSTVTAECDSTSAVTSGEVATQYSGSVVSAVIGDCVTSISGSTFRNCTSLESITIPNSVTSIGSRTFYDCSSLTSVTIPSGVTRIGTYAFYGCSSLTSVTVNVTTPPRLESIAFDKTNNCPIYVPAESVSTYKSTTRWSDYASRIQAIP